jgi:hypothetical protein
MKSPHGSSTGHLFLFSFLTACLICSSVVGGTLQRVDMASGQHSRDLILQADGGAPPPPPPPRPIPGIPGQSQNSTVLG